MASRINPATPTRVKTIVKLPETSVRDGDGRGGPRRYELYKSAHHQPTSSPAKSPPRSEVVTEERTTYVRQPSPDRSSHRSRRSSRQPSRQPIQGTSKSPVSRPVEGSVKSPPAPVPSPRREKNYEVWPPPGMVYFVDEDGAGKVERRPPSPPRKQDTRERERGHRSRTARTVRIEALSDVSVRPTWSAFPPNSPNTGGGGYSNNACCSPAYGQQQMAASPYRQMGSPAAVGYGHSPSMQQMPQQQMYMQSPPTMHQPYFG